MADPIAKLPPQNVEAEQSVLGALMLDKDAIAKIADYLEPKDFYRHAHQIIYQAMLDIYKNAEPIDHVSLVNRLKNLKQLEAVGSSVYLANLVNAVPAATHVLHYARIVKEKRILRDLIDASSHILGLGYKEDEVVEKLVDEAEQRIFNIAQRSSKRDFLAVEDLLQESFQRIDKLNQTEGALRGVPTGFKDLDNLLSGLQRSDLVILAARPSVGKTTLALDIARNAAQANLAVGIFSLEMSKDQLVDRLLAAEAGLDLWRLRTGRLSETDFANLQKAFGGLSKLPLYIDDSGSSTILEMRAMARRLQSERGLDLVVIDYLQLMRTNGRIENRVQEISEISRSLKALARELNVPVLALSQLSRGVEHRPDHRPRLADLRDSGCLSGDTIIIRADTGERLSIESLVGKTNIPVLSLTADLKITAKTISKVFLSGIKEVFELCTRSGRKIKASANHPFLTTQGWQHLDELRVGAQLGLPRVLPIADSHDHGLETDELILLAHLIGDGCVLANQPIHYTNADKENLAIVQKTAQRLFKIKPRLVQQKNWWHVYLPSPYQLARGKYHPITLWFRKLGLALVRSYEKRLPESLFTCPPEKICLFLRHLWATDGNISIRQPGIKSATASIYYATASEQLAEDVLHLLLRVGIIGTLRIVAQKEGYRPMYQVHVQGSVMQSRFCEQIGAYGKRGKIVPFIQAALNNIKPNPNLDVVPQPVWQTFIAPARIKAGLSWREFANQLGVAYNGSAIQKTGISRLRLGTFATLLAEPKLSQLAQSDIYWDEIVSITSLGKMAVFDATVPDTHNFIANDFIVHNSIEQDADVVMFIYRDDLYKPNADQKNVASIMVEKHRNGPTGLIQLFFNASNVRFESLEKHYEESMAPHPELEAANLNEDIFS